jgi:hypothetical protein
MLAQDHVASGLVIELVSNLLESSNQRLPRNTG